MTQGSKRFNPSKIRVGPKTFRRMMRLFPPIRNSGLRVDYISDDWRIWRMRLPMSLKTRNYVGTHWGGTLYSAADSQFMLAWLNILAKEYEVWDKAASIRFRRPGFGTLRAEFEIPAGDIEAVKAACAAASDGKHERTYQLEWRNDQGEVVATVEKLIHFRKKSTPASSSARK